MGGRARRAISPRSALPSDVNVFDAVITHVEAADQGDGKRVVVACWSEGARDRMGQVLVDHGLTRLKPVADWREAQALGAGHDGARRPRARSRLRHDDARRHRRAGHPRRPPGAPARQARGRPTFSADVTALAEGDLVVHIDHGIGRFRRTEDDRGGGRAARLPGNPLRRQRPGLPAGREHRTSVALRLGRKPTSSSTSSAASPGRSRKARMKKRIRDMAEALIKVAAARAMKSAPALHPAGGRSTTNSPRASPTRRPRTSRRRSTRCIGDLGAGTPMDRLICGDVGFGKTEVALRAAFITAHGRPPGRRGGADHAARPPALQDLQHPLRRPAGASVAQASRLVGAKELAAVKAGIADGGIDIVVGTHALLGKGIAFPRPRAADRRRGAALRRQAQGAAEGAEGRRPRADPLGHAHPAHAPAGPYRRARAVADHHAADRSAGGEDLHLAVRSRWWCARRCCASAIAAARASMSARASATSPSATPSSPSRAGGEGGGRQRPDGRRASSKTS